MEDTCNAFYHVFNSEKLVGQIINSGTTLMPRIFSFKIAKIMGRNISIKQNKNKMRPIAKR